MRFQLLEPRDTVDFERIRQAAEIVGLATQHLESITAASADATLVAVGPNIGEPLEAARHLRRIGSQALLIFFTASSSQRDALHAELIRDPFLYPRCEVIQLPDNPRQLAVRLARVITHVKSQQHASPSGPRRRRHPARNATVRLAGTTAGEHYLANILANTSDAMLSTDPALQILSWNSAAERLFGLTADEAIGQSLAILNDSASANEGLADAAKRIIASGDAEQAQVTCRSAADASTEVSVSIVPVRDGQGATLGLSLIAHDDSDYQRVEEALRDANRQKDEFLAIMSHELRTPLTSILGYTDMLLRGLSGPLAPLTNKYVGNVRMAGDRLLELVNGLLDYTRLEAGVERLELRPVDLSRVVGQAVQHCQPVAASKQIDLRLAVGKGVAARVDADEDKLTHVLRAFVGNALKFTSNGGWVLVRIGPDPDVADAVRVSVADSGIGIRAEVLPRVWERFYQGDASLTRPYGGMGLGLSIARLLVTLHGGTVGATSPGPQAGSTFWFTLPLGRST
ncbi:MAG TPA: ATP-binding protein [Chloroflexota bacterium]|jgi:PAS domain S-box-containing protein|nr:ATP-binding protein [Chloroflexota bacterium]